jgi:uncharacterized protein with HEPN domain
MPFRRPENSFGDIVENIERIENYTSGVAREAVFADPMRTDAIERCLQRITEAAARLGADADRLAPGIPWPNVRAFGNRLRHGYDSLQPETTRRIIFDQLPPLKAACLTALPKLPDPED